MANVPTPDTVPNVDTRDRASAVLKAAAIAAGGIASVQMAAGIALSIARLHQSTGTRVLTADLLWLYGGAIAFGLAAVAAAAFARVSRALFELELDRQRRGLFRRGNHCDPPAEVVDRLARSIALGMTEFNDPPAPAHRMAETAVVERPTAPHSSGTR